MINVKYVTTKGKVAEADVKSFDGDDAWGTDNATGARVTLLWNGRVFREVA